MRRTLPLLVVACGFVQPRLVPDGSDDRSTLRGGVSSIVLDDSCAQPQTCTVQLSVGPGGPRARRFGRLSVVEVRLFARGVLLGALEPSTTSVWQQSSYVPWDGRLRVGLHATRLSVELGPVDWSRLLAPIGATDPTREEISVEVVLRDGDERLPIPSIFAVRPTRWESRMIVT